MSLICPSGLLDEDAVALALSRLPRRLEKDYQRRLERLELGCILELALLGRLLQRGGPFLVTRWPEGGRFDGFLVRDERRFELEIKASIETRYDKNVTKMCRMIKEEIERRWPGFIGEVNLFNRFREKEEDGVKTLDIDGTAVDVMAELECAITPDGQVRRAYREYVPFRLVTKIEPLDYLKVLHSSWTLPGGHGQDVVRRTLKRALDDKNQFTGKLPAVLAVIQARDPMAALIYRGEPSVADEFFGRHPKLSAIIAVPCPSINGPATIITPDPQQLPSRVHPVLDEDLTPLADLFAVRLQVDPFWEALEEEIRQKQKDAERPLQSSG